MVDLSAVTRARRPVDVKAKTVWTDLGGVELIEPHATPARSRIPGDSRTWGPPHHAWVADYEQSRQHLASNGVPLLLEGQLQNTRFCLFDGSDELGMILELADGDGLEADAELKSMPG